MIETEGGGKIFQRNERLTLRVGPLPKGWEKKVDKRTGRTYFKNHETRMTSWVDPRSAMVRAMEADETKDESDLPSGGEEAETAGGEKYFIDHNTQSTYWKHPRLILEEKRLEFVEKQKDVEKKALVGTLASWLRSGPVALLCSALGGLCGGLISFIDCLLFSSHPLCALCLSAVETSQDCQAVPRQEEGARGHQTAGC